MVHAQQRQQRWGRRFRLPRRAQLAQCPKLPSLSQEQLIPCPATSCFCGAAILGCCAEIRLGVANAARLSPKLALLRQKTTHPVSGEVAYFFFDAQSAQNCGTRGSRLFSPPASAARLSPLQTSDLPPNWLRSVEKQLIPPRRGRLFFSCTKCTKMVAQPLMAAAPRLFSARASAARLSPKLASFRQKTTHPPGDAAYLFSVHKVHKLAGCSAETLLGAGERNSPIPMANKRLAPKLASFRQKTTHPARRGRLFFSVHKVHKLAGCSPETTLGARERRSPIPIANKRLAPKLASLSAGINRHDVENERVLQERSSDPS